MRRLAAISLVLWFLALGTGSVSFLHLLEHQRQDASARSIADQSEPNYPPQHDDSNCLMHAQLHLPMVSIGWVPLLVCLGLFVAFLSLLTPELASQGTLSAFHCRGPPSC